MARRENSSTTSAATREPTSASTPVSTTTCSSSSTHRCAWIASFSACLFGLLGTARGTLSRTGCPLPLPPPQNGVTASETSPVLCGGERRVQPLPCSGHRQHPWVLRAASPIVDPKSRSPKEMPPGGKKSRCLLQALDVQVNLQEAAEHRDGAGTHQPCGGKGSSGSPAFPRMSPSRPHATPGGSHLAGAHPAAPSPTPARATLAARTPEKTCSVERSHGVVGPRLQGPRGGGWERPPRLVNHCWDKRGQLEPRPEQLSPSCPVEVKIKVARGMQ